MKKIVLLSMVALFLMGAVAFATSSVVHVYSWGGTPTVWTEVSSTSIASGTSSGFQNNTGLNLPYVYFNGVNWSILPASPTWTQLHRINWNVRISQWIYISMQYLDYQMHVDAPGDYMFDSFTIHAASNGGVYVYMSTGGALTTTSNVSTPTIPTWLGYKVDDSSAPSLGLPSNSGNNAFWYDMDWINSNYGTPAQQLTIYPGVAWDHTLHGWFGFRVDSTVVKGNYATWLDIYIQSDP